MAKLRPGRHAFLLQIEACTLIESPHKDPLDALDHFLADPDSKAISVHITEATSNSTATRRVQLRPYTAASAQPLDNLVHLDKYRALRNSPA